MKNRHIFNRTAAFGISRKAIFASAVAAAVFGIPVLAVAGPSVGLGYSDIGLSGHAGRPGATLTAGNLYKNNVVAWGSATYARGYYNVSASIGKLVPAGGVSFTPYASLGFLNLNYSQQETGYNSQTISNFGYSFTETTPYSYTQPESITDIYGLAGVDLNIPIGSRVAVLVGGGYGHTISVFGGNGNGGAVYKGKAEIGMEVAKHVTASINASYIHIPGQSITTYGAGLSYHFS